MTKRSKTIVWLLICVSLIALCIALPACSSPVETFTVTYQYGNEQTHTEEVESGDHLADVPTDVDMDGFAFKGWKIGDEFIDTETYTVTGDVTLGASYAETFTVRFLNWDGTLLKEEEVESGAAATAPSAPERDGGYEFVEWDQAFDNVTSDLEVTAVFEDIAAPELEVEGGDATLENLEAKAGEWLLLPRVKSTDNADGNLTESILAMSVPDGVTFEKISDQSDENWTAYRAMCESAGVFDAGFLSYDEAGNKGSKVFQLTFESPRDDETSVTEEENDLANLLEDGGVYKENFAKGYMSPLISNSMPTMSYIDSISDGINGSSLILEDVRKEICHFLNLMDYITKSGNYVFSFDLKLISGTPFNTFYFCVNQGDMGKQLMNIRVPFDSLKIGEVKHFDIPFSLVEDAKIAISFFPIYTESLENPTKIALDNIEIRYNEFDVTSKVPTQEELETGFVWDHETNMTSLGHGQIVSNPNTGLLTEAQGFGSKVMSLSLSNEGVRIHFGGAQDIFRQGAYYRISVPVYNPAGDYNYSYRLRLGSPLEISAPVVREGFITYSGTDSGEGIITAEYIFQVGNYASGMYLSLEQVNSTYPSFGQYNIILGDITVEKLVLENLEIEKQADKTEYIEGQVFNPAGMKVNAVFTGDRRIDVTEFVAVDVQTPLALGQESVKISYLGMEVIHPVTVIARKIVRIEVTPPDKVTYESGEMLNLEGLVVEAIYNDGTREVLTDGFTLNPAADDVLTADDTAVVVTHTATGLETSFEIQVGRVATGIEIAKQPDRTIFFEGEFFDPTGMELMLQFETGDSMTITAGYDWDLKDALTLSNTVVEITYEGFTTKLTIEVVLENYVPSAEEITNGFTWDWERKTMQVETVPATDTVGSATVIENPMSGTLTAEQGFGNQVLMITTVHQHGIHYLHGFDNVFEAGKQYKISFSYYNVAENLPIYNYRVFTEAGGRFLNDNAAIIMSNAPGGGVVAHAEYVLNATAEDLFFGFYNNGTDRSGGTVYIGNITIQEVSEEPGSDIPTSEEIAQGYTWDWMQNSMEITSPRPTDYEIIDNPMTDVLTAEQGFSDQVLRITVVNQDEMQRLHGFDNVFEAGKQYKISFSYYNVVEGLPIYNYRVHTGGRLILEPPIMSNSAGGAAVVHVEYILDATAEDLSFAFYNYGTDGAPGGTVYIGNITIQEVTGA